jgi:hypothetical protein
MAPRNVGKKQKATNTLPEMPDPNAESAGSGADMITPGSFGTCLSHHGSTGIRYRWTMGAAVLDDFPAAG